MVSRRRASKCEQVTSELHNTPFRNCVIGRKASDFLSAWTPKQSESRDWPRVWAESAGRGSPSIETRGSEPLVLGLADGKWSATPPLPDCSYAIITATIHSLRARLDMLGSRRPRPVNCPWTQQHTVSLFPILYHLPSSMTEPKCPGPPCCYSLTCV